MSAAVIVRLQQRSFISKYLYIGRLNSWSIHIMRYNIMP